MSRVRLDLRVTKLTTDETLERKDGVRRVDDGLTLCGKTDKTFTATVLGEGDNGGCRPVALSILNDARGLALHDGGARLRGAQVNTDDRSIDLAVHIPRNERARKALYDC